MNPYQHSFGGNIPQDVAGGNKAKMLFLLFIL